MFFLIELNKPVKILQKPPVLLLWVIKTVICDGSNIKPNLQQNANASKQLYQNNYSHMQAQWKLMNTPLNFISRIIQQFLLSVRQINANYLNVLKGNKYLMIKNKF